jgi:hypothetical protein
LPCSIPLGNSGVTESSITSLMTVARSAANCSTVIGRSLMMYSLALASLDHACRDHVPTFPQRSPPSLLTTAACGGLRSTPDCRTRRAILHLSERYGRPMVFQDCRQATRPSRPRYLTIASSALSTSAPIGITTKRSRSSCRPGANNQLSCITLSTVRLTSALRFCDPCSSIAGSFIE